MVKTLVQLIVQRGEDAYDELPKGTEREPGGDEVRAMLAAKGIQRGREWRVQFLSFSPDFELSRVRISVPSPRGPDANGLQGCLRAADYFPVGCMP